MKKKQIQTNQNGIGKDRIGIEEKRSLIAVE